MKQLFKQADFLVTPINFNTKEHGSSKSVLGGFSSILIIIFTICYFLGVLIKSLGSLSDIYAGSQSDQDTNSVKYLENTLVAIEISNDKGNILSNMTEISQYINITGQYIQQQRIEEVEGYKRNYTSLNIINCSKDKVEQFNFDPQAMTQKQKENLICFDGYFNLQGQFYDSYFSFFRIMVQVCNNTTSNNCKSLDEIKSFVDSGIKIDLFIQSARIRLKYNQQNPAYLYPNTIYWKLSSQAANNEDIYMETVVLDIKKTKFLNNVFGVSNDERIFQGQVVQKQERRQDSTSIDHNAVLASFYLRQSAEFQYYFMIQQDFIALFFQAISLSTGLFLAILEVAKFTYRFYNERYSLKTIMNNVYLFNLNPQMQSNNEINSQIQGQKSEKILQQQLEFSILKLIKYEIKGILTKKKSTQKVSELPTDGEQNTIFSAIAKRSIEKELDLSNILKKLYEIDFLKLLLLDDNQLRLFNAVCKPIFSDYKQTQTNEEQKLSKKKNQVKIKKNKKKITPPLKNGIGIGSGFPISIKSSQINFQWKVYKTLKKRIMIKQILNCYQSLANIQDYAKFQKKIQKILKEKIIQEYQKSQGKKKSSTLKRVHKIFIWKQTNSKIIICNMNHKYNKMIQEIIRSKMIKFLDLSYLQSQAIFSQNLSIKIVQSNFNDCQSICLFLNIFLCILTQTSQFFK